MPIHVPGVRKKNRRGQKGAKRTLVATLSLTAMVDMFTVLVVFLLQNYRTTGEAIYIPKEVKLPQAHTVKELKPSNVVVISQERIMVNSEFIADFSSVKEQEDWEISKLKARIIQMIEDGKKEDQEIKNRFTKAMKDAKEGSSEAEDEIPKYRKITIQADKSVDFLSVKKVMYTVTEAGIAEINFAVLKVEDEKPGS